MAAADLTGDGRAGIVAGAGGGGSPHVCTFDPAAGEVMGGPLGSFLAGDGGSRHGAFVGTDALTGDGGGDGTADLAVGSGVGEEPRVTVYSGRDGSVVRELVPFAAGMTAGVRVAAAFATDDAHANLVMSAGPGGDARVLVFDGETPSCCQASWARTSRSGRGYTGGVTVAASNDPPGGTQLHDGTVTLTSAYGSAELTM